MLTALTRPVSTSITRCALSFMERDLIDLDLARRQHEAYEDCLRSLGVRVQAVPAEDEMPDAVFVEDTVVVVDELAVMTYPTLPSRQCERRTVAEALKPFRPLEWIEGDGRLEGGDVLRVGRTLYAGLSRRTNAQGIAQLRQFLAPHGYEVVSVPVPGCLHLKTGAVALDGHTLLANPAWVDIMPFADWEILHVPEEEAFAANVLVIGQSILMPTGFPRTEAMLRARGYRICPVPMTELQKAEAGVTCCSVIFTSPWP
jgi:dimethylargininase